MEKITTSALGLYINLMSVIAPKIAAWHGFNIFCYPVRPKLKPRHINFLDSAEKFKILLNNTKIQCYKWGNGSKKVLFVHGWKSHTYFWKNYIESLAGEDFTLYSMDAPGHGLSEGNFLHVPYYSQVIGKFVNSVGAIDTVVSHSVGSFAFLHLLFSQPDVPVKNVVLMAPPRKASDFFEYYCELLNLSDRSKKLVSDYFEKAIKKSISFYSTERFASEVTVPGLIIHDLNDDETPYESAVNVHIAWRNSKLITTKGFGHKLKSDEVVKVVKDFIIEQNLVVNEE